MKSQVEENKYYATSTPTGSMNIIGNPLLYSIKFNDEFGEPIASISDFQVIFQISKAPIHIIKQREAFIQSNKELY